MNRALVEAEKNINNVMVKNSTFIFDITSKGMRHLMYTFFFFLMMQFTSYGQGVNITEHGSIRSLMNNYIFNNKEAVTVDGWRIQIITTSDRRRMEKALVKFQRMYPDMIADWSHRNPNYQVKVGAFRDKLDYQGFLLKVKQDFPSALPVREQLRKEELLR